MKFKNFINNDIEQFRKLNVGIVEDSKEEVVRKIEEEYEIKNEAMELINHINRLLGKKKIGFTFEDSDIEKEIKKFNEKKKETIKIKLLETNSILSKMKMELEKKLK